MRYKDMTTEQKEEFKARVKKYQAEHREEVKAYQKKWYAEHSEEHKAYQRKYYAEHIEEHKASMRKSNAEHKEERSAYQRRMYAEDLNKNGVSKVHIRIVSGRILKKVHAKLDGYEIHHCFGYEDPDKFIYIPRKLHREIHSILCSLHILAEENHWNVIRDMVNSCEEYTYIRC